MATDPAISPQSNAPQVVAVVTADDPDLLGPCLDAIERQVYGPARVVVVGGSDAVRHLAGEREAMWRPNLRAVYDSLGPEFTFVWALRQRARPEPGALAALLGDGMRADASVAGSKVVDATHPERLISVGYATDVFNAPFSGLEAGELDQAQYDVIRDVAAVSDTSMLIRRDLFRGLGGVDPLMPPTSAAVDFCQRARLRGARVVVVPSSVVRYEGPDPAPHWRERAGETRAMIKAYSPLTLLWAIPVAFLVGIVESVLGLVIGRFPLPGLLAAGGWNLVHLPSAIRGRFQARRGRQVGDEELFRYQVNGSARIRQAWDEVARRIKHRFPEGVLSGFSEAVESGQQKVRNPAFFVGFLVVVAALVATREVWGGQLPLVGYSLLPPESPIEALGAYAGGWNPAGFGSPEVLRPHVAATAFAQIVTLGRASLAVTALLVASSMAGAFGMARLLRTWGVRSTAGLFAGLVLMTGPGMAAAAATTHWTVIPSIGALPWAWWLATRPWGGTLRERIRSVAPLVLTMAVVGMFSPVILLVAVVAVPLAWVVGVGGAASAAWRSALAAVLAVPALLPWLLYEDFGRFFTDGPAAFWVPAWWVVAATAALVIGGVLTDDRPLASLAVWGGVMAAVGAAIARLGSFGAGTEASVAGLAAVAAGVAIAAGAGLEAGSRRRQWRGVSALAGFGAAAAAGLLLLSTLVVIGPGRSGLPGDRFGSAFRFATGDTGSVSRILMFGPAEALPGDHRTFDGLPYRVILPPYPRTWEAYLNEPRLGDEALHGFLVDLVEGRVRRAGEALAGFGIGWVVFTEPSPLQVLFEAQLDLAYLRSLSFPVFRNEVATAPAMSIDGSPWTPRGTGYRAPLGVDDPVYLALNADDRWGPGEWTQEDWAAVVVGSTGRVDFGGYPPRRAMAIAGWLWLGVLAAGWGLTREPRP